VVGLVAITVVFMPA